MARVSDYLYRKAAANKIPLNGCFELSPVCNFSCRMCYVRRTPSQLKEEGKLRGCIGTISPVQECIGEEILENAVSAATRDPRFLPVQPEELERLVYSVDVLSEAEEISSEKELDVERYGVIVSRGYKRGLLLPNLEGVDTVRQQIDIAKRKAGIPEEAEDIRLERFEVVRHF